LRDVIGSIPLSDVISNIEVINAKIRENLEQISKNWGITIESITLPNNICGWIEGKSSIGRFLNDSSWFSFRVNISFSANRFTDCSFVTVEGPQAFSAAEPCFDMRRKIMKIGNDSRYFVCINNPLYKAGQVETLPQDYSDYSGFQDGI